MCRIIAKRRYMAEVSSQECDSLHTSKGLKDPLPRRQEHMSKPAAALAYVKRLVVQTHLQSFRAPVVCKSVESSGIAGSSCVVASQPIHRCSRARIYRRLPADLATVRELFCGSVSSTSSRNSQAARARSSDICVTPRPNVQGRGAEA